MTKEQQYVSTEIDSDKRIFQKPIKVKNKMGRQIQGHLQIEETNAKGQFVVSASYNYNASRVGVTFAKAYLTQAEMDAFDKDGSACIFEAPEIAAKWV
jgi:hypothetical protein